MDLIELAIVDIMESMSSNVLCTRIKRNNLFCSSNKQHDFVPSSMTTTWVAMIARKHQKLFTPISTWLKRLSRTNIEPNVVHVSGEKMVFGTLCNANRIWFVHQFFRCHSLEQKEKILHHSSLKS